jgi:dTDP-4-dehydrorhamnose reductase
VKVLVTGAGGLLAQAVRSALRAGRHDVVALGHAQLDVCDARATRAAVTLTAPDAVVHCAAYTRVDDAETDEAAAFAVNADGTLNVAAACAAVGARLLYPSTDYVFDGRATTPYPPTAPTAPLNAYGRSKLAGEAAAREAGGYLIVRTSWLYGSGGSNFVSTVLRRARAGEQLEIVQDQHGAPTWTRDIATVMTRLLELEVSAGVYHATNRGATTWYDLASRALHAAGVNGTIRPVLTADRPRPAQRPAYSVLDCRATESLTGPLPHWRAALDSAIAAGALS